MLQHSNHRGPKEERKKGTDNKFENTIAENFPNPGEETDIQVQEAEREKEKSIKRNEDNLRDLWDNVKHPNI